MRHLFALLFLALATQAHAGEFGRVHATAAQLAHSNPGCAAKCGKVFLDTDTRICAHIVIVGSEQWVLVTSGMAEKADDSELAFVIAHEMAHSLGADSELDADAKAIEMMSNAGYDVTAAERILARLDRPFRIPSMKRRIAAVREAIAKL